MPQRVPEVHRGERAGIPLLWSPADLDPRVALVFRVGRVDEAYVQSGVTHLVEHLVLTELGAPAHEINGFVGIDLTGFTARGTVDEVTAFLEHVATSVADLPVERLAVERGVLEAEAAQEGLGVHDVLNGLRWGATPYGRPGIVDLGARSATVDGFRAWARDHFTRAAAVLCWIGPEPPELGWRLAEGAARPLPAVPDSFVATPAVSRGGADGVAVSVTLHPGPSAAVFGDLLHHRVTQVLRHERGLVYGIDAFSSDIAPDIALFGLLAEVGEVRAGDVSTTIVAELEVLAAGKVDEAELAASRRRITDAAAADTWISAHLLEMASGLLTGRPMLMPVEELALVAAVDASMIASQAERALSSAILLLPDSVPAPEGWADADEPPQREPVTGQRFRTGGRLARRRDELVVGERGFTLTPARDAPITIAWDDLVAATPERNGSWNLVVRDGGGCVIMPELFDDRGAVQAAFERHVDAAVRVAPRGSEQDERVAELASRDLRSHKGVTAELQVLPELLEPGEELLGMASMLTGMKPGLVAVTTRRTMFVLAVLDEPEVQEVRHTSLPGVRVEDDWKGPALILETQPEATRYWGADRKTDAARLRDLIARYLRS